MPKIAIPKSWVLPVAIVTGVVLLAMFTPRLPGDPQVQRAVQGLGIPAAPAAFVTSLVSKPTVYVWYAVGLLLATWRGRLRGFVTSALLILLWEYAGEPLKTVVQRPRPTADLVEVVRVSHGYSFPSTFATAWFSAWLPACVYAWRTRRRSAGTAIAIVTGLLIAIGMWARIRMGAHWPSDLLMTLGLVWGTFAIIDLVVDQVDGPA